MLPDELRTARFNIGYNLPSQFARRLGISSKTYKSFEDGFKIYDGKFKETLPPLFISYACGWLLLYGDRRPPWPAHEDCNELRNFHKENRYTLEALGMIFEVSRQKMGRVVKSNEKLPTYFGFVIAWLKLYGTIDPFPNQYCDFREIGSIQPFLGDDT